MISGKNKIDVLDIYKEKKINSTVEDIIKNCNLSVKAIYSGDIVDGYMKAIECEVDRDRKIYLRDLSGWTLLTKIEKFILKENKSFKLNDDIIVYDNEAIPVYSKDRYNVGFHGTLLYKYDLINASDIEMEDIPMVRTGLNDFIQLDIKEINHIPEEAEYGYRIFTNAGMYSIGSLNIQLSGGINKKNRYY